MARQLAGPEGADDIVQDTFLRTPEGRLVANGCNP